MKTQTYITVLTLISMFSALQAASDLTVTASPQKYAALPADAFPVDYTVSWTDSDGDYVVLPPELPMLDWGTATLQELVVSGTNETRLTVAYRTKEAGTYTVPAFDIRLLEGSTETEATIAKVEEGTPAQVVEAAATEVVFRDSRTGLWVGGIVTFLALAGGLIWYRARKHRLTSPAESGLSPAERAQELLHEARRSRLDGDFYAFYRALSSALTCIETNASESHAALIEKMKRAIDDTGYRGIRPSDDVMEGDFKDVERLVAQEMQRTAKEN